MYNVSTANPALFRWNWGGLVALITFLNGPQNLKTISMSLLFTFDFISNPLRYKCCPGSQTIVMVQRELSTLGTFLQIQTRSLGKGGTGASPGTHPTLEAKLTSK